MGKKLLIKLESTLAMLSWAPISIHQKFLLLRSCGVTAVNYGPLVEQENQEDR